MSYHQTLAAISHHCFSFLNAAKRQPHQQGCFRSHIFRRSSSREISSLHCNPVDLHNATGILHRNFLVLFEACQLRHLHAIPDASDLTHETKIRPRLQNLIKARQSDLSTEGLSVSVRFRKLRLTRSNNTTPSCPS